MAQQRSLHDRHAVPEHQLRVAARAIPVRLQSPARSVAAAIADFDEDGLPDIAVAQAAADGVALFLNQSKTWASLGFDLAPSAGGAAPLLRGRGHPAPTEGVSIMASGSGATSSGLLFVGLGAEFTPLHGGFLVPGSAIAAVIHGDVPLASRWPAGIAPGTPVYLQAVFASGEVLLTNALVVIAR